MDAYQRLLEGLPNRLPPVRSRRMGEKAVRDAIAVVPLANPAQAASEVEHLLDAVLAAVWSGGERMAALAHLYAPVASLCRDVEHKLGAESYPLPAGNAARAALAQRLEWKLACACALGVHEWCAPVGKIPLFKTKAVAAACVAGLLHAGQTLLWAYRQYAAPPAGAWRLLHGLYAFAQEAGVADQAVADPLVAGAATAARSVYLQALLLAASGPQRFSARELRDAEAAIRCVADACGLAPGHGPGLGVDAGSDAGPAYIAEDGWSASTLALDVAPAARTFDECCALLPAGAEQVELPRPGGVQRVRVEFLRHVQAGWVTAARSHGRLAASHSLEVVVGMHALHYVLAGGVDFATFVRRVHSQAIAGGHHELASASAWAVGADGLAPPVLRADVLDQSEGGYRLRMQVDGSEGARLRVGDMVGLATAADSADERDWMVGLVRWLKHADAGELVGVELLHRTARAAGLRPVGADGKPLVPQRAVELPDNGQDRLSLLVASRFARDAATAEVVLPALASDWKVPAAAGVWRLGGAEDLGAACVRLTLVRQSDAAGGAA
ncbi:MAG: hypothetical protein EPN38_10400 [Rhodanobacteraceae bacterium]|nr:MAG: hypothetical protein EPN38_10400 [Rhodanobacteraceae bacterium]